MTKLESVTPANDGTHKYIEVKSSTGQAINEIILTSKEWQKACDSELAKSYYIYFNDSFLLFIIY